MKKIKTAEWLAAVAIITSATVMQIREHTQVQEAPGASADADADADADATRLSCDAKHDGLVLAGCRPALGEAAAEKDHAQNRATRPLRNASKMWV